MYFLRRLRQVLALLWPPTIIYTMRRGADLAAAFRSLHGREPTEQEWLAISNRVDQEIFR